MTNKELGYRESMRKQYSIYEMIERETKKFKMEQNKRNFIRYALYRLSLKNDMEEKHGN